MKVWAFPCNSHSTLKTPESSPYGIGKVVRGNYSMLKEKSIHILKTSE
jgi:hypothetical protein